MDMRIGIVCGCAAAAMAAGALSEQAILAHLDRMMSTPGQRYANIEKAEGAYMRDLVRKVNTKRAVEVGTSTGYSGIWIALALKETGGRLVTLEIDKGRHDVAVANFKAVGVDGLIDARLGDALAEIPKVEGPLEFAFIDAAKDQYLKYYELILPKMRKGGVIVAHNVKSHPEPMRDFLTRIGNDPKVRTEIVSPGYQGFSVSWVK